MVSSPNLVPYQGAPATPQVPQKGSTRPQLPAWLEVLKPRLIPLLLATTVGGMAVADPWPLAPVPFLATLVGGALAAAAAGFGAWELSTALRIKGWYVPRVPSVIGAILIMPATFWGGASGQWLISLGTVAALIAWRAIHLIWERRQALKQAFATTIGDFAASAFNQASTSPAF